MLSICGEIILYDVSSCSKASVFLFLFLFFYLNFNLFFIGAMGG